MAELAKKWLTILKKTDFIDSSESKTPEELKAQVLKSQGIIVDLESDIDNDVKLQSLKDDLKLLNGAYRDEIKMEMAKTAYCIHLMKERGGDTG